MPPFKKTLATALLFVLTVALLWSDLTQIKWSLNSSEYETVLKGRIVEEERQLITSEAGDLILQNLGVEVEGEEAIVWIENQDQDGENARIFEQGTSVFVSKFELPNMETLFTIRDYNRQIPIYVLFSCFLGLTILITGWKGLKAIAGMGFSFLVLFKWILPLLLNGMDPLLVCSSGALLIIPGTFYLSHGFNSKTHVAISGTLLTLFFTGILAKIVIPWSHLSGLADEASFYLKVESNFEFQFKSLLLSGFIIGLLGILDDITLTQASIAEELRKAKPQMGYKEHLARTMAVGKDHIASMVNTLILVYAGGNLSLLLFFTQSSLSFGQILSMEGISEELVRTLIGSIGLVGAVPLTTFLACIKWKNR